jgi:hypothetical protein
MNPVNDPLRLVVKAGRDHEASIQRAACVQQIFRQLQPHGMKGMIVGKPIGV